MQHFYTRVPGWFAFAGVYTDAVKAAPRSGAVFAEVGSWKGKSAAFMGVEIANSKKSIEFYCVDHWRGSDEPAHHSDPDVRAGRLYEVFLKNIKPVADYIRPLRAPSVAASRAFDDGTLDLVLLDAGHTYDDVKADLDAWVPKVKPGGVIAGDDWNWAGVHDAVLERFDAARVEILGEGKGRHWRVRL